MKRIALLAILAFTSLIAYSKYVIVKTASRHRVQKKN